MKNGDHFGSCTDPLGPENGSAFFASLLWDVSANGRFDCTSCSAKNCKATVVPWSLVTFGWSTQEVTRGFADIIK